MKKVYWLAGLALVCIVVISVVLLNDRQNNETAENNDETAQQVESNGITIKLVQNSWLAAQLNNEVAKIILEEKLGYTVELVETGGDAQWQGVANGDMHASLEIWPSGYIKQYQEYITDTGAVEFGGELGAIGKVGWYIPTYTAQNFPELVSWEGFQNPENIELFATAETEGKGRFLGGDPSWGAQYDEEIISNLGLNLQVVYSEGDDAESDILSQVEESFMNEEALVFYFWTPHWIHALYDLQEVALPPYTEDCYAVEEDIDCDYPAEILYKIVWSDLIEYAPSAHHLLLNFELTNGDQIAMMADVELEGKTQEEAARDWVNENEIVWQSWLSE